MSKGRINSITSSFIAIGGVIGAGFASGREIYTFFGGKASATVIGITIFAVMFVFTLSAMLFGNKRKISSMNGFAIGLLGKRSYIVNVAFLFCFYVVMSAMLSGTEELFSFVGIKFPLFSVITVIITALFIVRGIKGLNEANLILTPFLIAFIIYITSTFHGETALIGKTDIWKTCYNGLMYVAMNFCLSSEVLSECGSFLTKKQCVISSLITSFVIAIMVSLFINALSKGDFELVAIPLIKMTDGKGNALKIIAIMTLFFAILTTLLSSSFPVYSLWKERTKGKIFPLLLTFLPPLFLSRLGFIKILSAFYPIESYIGIFALISIVSGTLLPAFPKGKRDSI